MNRKPIGFYNYTVILTYIGMLVGLYGIASAIAGQIHISFLCLMLSGVCDMFDGTIASTRERNLDEKCFGIQIDSLSDFLCFCVLPAVIVMNMSSQSKLSFGVAAFFVLCGLIRLANFNVEEQNRQRETEERRDYFYGLPVTSIAVILPFFMILSGLLSLKIEKPGVIILLVVGILNLTPFKMKKPQTVGKTVMSIIGALVFICLIMGLGDI